MGKRAKSPRGGHGGSVRMIGGAGRAEGGDGGRGGSSGYGRGGDGGGGVHVGGGYSRGGDGGDAGRPARPALGAKSPLCYSDFSRIPIPGITDIYEIPQPGKGGDSYIAYVVFSGYKYCLNILLQLMSGFCPRIIANTEIINLVDEAGLRAGIQTEQEWWELAVKMFPTETAAVMEHVKNCEATARKNADRKD